MFFQTVRSVYIVIFLAINLTLSIGSYIWLHKLTKDSSCECSNLEERRKLHVLIPIAIGLLLISSGFAIYSKVNPLLSSPLVSLLVLASIGLALIILYIMIIVYAIRLLKKLKLAKCECALSGSGDEFMIGYVIYLFIVLIFQVVTLFIGILTAVFIATAASSLRSTSAIKTIKSKY